MSQNLTDPDSLMPIGSTPLEKAIGKTLRLVVSSIAAPIIRQMWRVTECPESLLPYIAHSLSVDRWETSWTAAKKRAVIAESIADHRKKGTIGAMKEAIAEVSNLLQVIEWSHGRFTFRVGVNVTGMTAAQWPVIDYGLAKSVALRTKNARSHLGFTGPFATQSGGSEIVSATYTKLRTYNYAV